MAHDPGRTAYDAYRNAVGGTALVAGDLPDWAELDDKLQKRWRDATDAVLKALPAPEEAEEPSDLKMVQE